MQLLNIELKDGFPVQIVVSMSVDEAARVARSAGSASPSTNEDAELYNCLAGELFNRYWDEGLAGYGDGS